MTRFDHDRDIEEALRGLRAKPSQEWQSRALAHLRSLASRDDVTQSEVERIQGQTVTWPFLSLLPTLRMRNKFIPILAVVVVLVVGMSIGSLANSATPQSSFYAIDRGLERVEIGIASLRGRPALARAYLQQADERVDEMVTIVGNDAANGLVLRDMLLIPQAYAAENGRGLTAEKRAMLKELVEAFRASLQHSTRIMGELAADPSMRDAAHALAEDILEITEHLADGLGEASDQIEDEETGALIASAADTTSDVATQSIETMDTIAMAQEADVQQETGSGSSSSSLETGSGSTSSSSSPETGSGSTSSSSVSSSSSSQSTSEFSSSVSSVSSSSSQASSADDDDERGDRKEQAKHEIEKAQEKIEKAQEKIERENEKDKDTVQAEQEVAEAQSLLAQAQTLFDNGNYAEAERVAREARHMAQKSVSSIKHKNYQRGKDRNEEEDDDEGSSASSSSSSSSSVSSSVSSTSSASSISASSVSSSSSEAQSSQTSSASSVSSEDEDRNVESDSEDEGDDDNKGKSERGNSGKNASRNPKDNDDD
ncbi:MAG: hypothetical protein ABIG34_04960 [Candidatus Peregrinibacteria bacterium]